MAGVLTKLKSKWNIFRDVDPNANPLLYADVGSSAGFRPDRNRYRIGHDRSLVNALYTRMAIDIASVDIRHVKLGDNRRYLEDIDSSLQECFRVEANLDQAARMFRQDIVTTLFEEGVLAIVPVDTTGDPYLSEGYDIKTLRVGVIKAWYPQQVRVSLYDERNGQRQEIDVPKRLVAIVENPLYAVMNEPSSMLKRLIEKLNLLDGVDRQIASGKLDLLIQLPYVVKSEARKKQAEDRKKDIERQMQGSQYGIAYIDATEKVTQLNRPAENNLLTQVQFLTEQVYAQLGLTKGVFDGTAEESEMLNYHNRTIEPILSAIVQEMQRKFLTKTARTQKQSIEFFRDPFRLVPISNLAELGDKFTRNEIMTGNEFRAVIGLEPSKDPKADELRNKNLPEINPAEPKPQSDNQEGDVQNGSEEG